MLFLLGPDGHAPLPVTSQHLLGETYPAPPPGRTYPQLKLLCRKLLMEEWELAAPDPARYAYRPSLKPHPFMGLTKVDAGRLHQMRSGKSDLRAHPSWDDDGPTTCPSCSEPPRPSRTPSSTAQQWNPPGPATFRGSLSSVLTPPSGPQQPSWARSHASSGLRPPPSHRACFLARRLPLAQFLPAHLM